ncbi:MAG: phosphatidylglycerol lysyltransferase [Spirochaetaceae bacterium]|nr:phosphatidylglycerol lysyltransferase [Spirochaetaceae bacterium]
MQEFKAALENMILSPSGWRGVFASDDAKETACREESNSPNISESHALMAFCAAKVFADCLKRDTDHPTIIVGMDTRPTGPAIADAMLRAFAAENCQVRFAEITSAPEIMAYARSAESACGFVYISASHNPIGHNGLKFGRIDGGVLSAEEASKLIADFRAFTADPDRVARLPALSAPTPIPDVYAEAPAVKKEAYAAYLNFTKKVVFGVEKTLSQALIEGLQKKPLGIAVDFNGSARTLSIDREFFGELGIPVYAINDTPGGIAHKIVPEGEALEPCRRFLEETHQTHPEVILGYVPDCDGDRGNLVIWDEAAGKARSLEAQEGFALACVGEFAHLVWTGELAPDGTAGKKVAVAVNDPTSLRIDRIAQAFGVSVFRAEVGEANVVGLARRLREQGWTVRILGEGSAGGNITHPSAVRDPINTVMAIVKLLTLRGGDGREGFFDIWRRLSHQNGYPRDFSLSDLLDSLPKFTTTGSYTPEAALQVRTRDHTGLKDRYQTIFLRSWEERKEELRVRYGINGWTPACYNGMEERRGITRFGEAGKGGLKIAFCGDAGREKAWIWMRGSATEPVFRVMADAEGSDTALERDLIEWQRRMVIEADTLK